MQLAGQPRVVQTERDAAGEFEYFVAMVKDIQAEKEAQAALEGLGRVQQPERLPSAGREAGAPRDVSLQPDEKAQHWLLSVSASDRVGLLYGIAQVLAKHHINLKLAKVSTLGERVEDTFLIDGPDLQQNRRQIEIETELVSALQG